MENNKKYVKKLKLKESVKTGLMITFFITLMFIGLLYQSYRVEQLDNNQMEDISRVIEVNFTR